MAVSRRLRCLEQATVGAAVFALVYVAGLAALQWLGGHGDISPEHVRRMETSVYRPLMWYRGSGLPGGGIVTDFCAHWNETGRFSEGAREHRVRRRVRQYAGGRPKQQARPHRE